MYVFVWIGDEEPAAIEEDVPEEFFDPRFHIFFNDQIVWNTSWEVALENSMDAHVNYLHREACSVLGRYRLLVPGRSACGCAAGVSQLILSWLLYMTL